MYARVQPEDEMTTQDGPAEIDRTLLPGARTFFYWPISCLYCHTSFLSRSDAKLHDATCLEHPAVQQLGLAKRFIARIIELYDKSYTVEGPDIWDAATKHGILVETKYDPALHGEQDAEAGDAWYVIAEAWRV